MCGDDRDLINGRPTGSCRVSFAYHTTIDDVLYLLNFLSNNFQCSTNRKQYIDEQDDILKCFFEQSSRKHLAAKPKADNTGYMDKSMLASSLSNGTLPTSVITNSCRDDIVLSKLYLYPVKSCAAFEVRRT